MKYLKILSIRSIQRYCDWLQPRPPDNFRASCKPVVL